MKVPREDEMIEPKTPYLLACTLEMILYEIPIKLIGRLSSTCSATFTYGKWKWSNTFNINSKQGK